ncbi:MAG: cell division ATP-binding protein FtsE [Firmicutes bacterium]|nr:cell division ATP-binding protein FtsE [Bacillota bacterium]
MITFKNVTKNYGDGSGLIDASLEIADGEFVFLVGPSGAGKSTFINLVTRELKPDEGEITVNGQNVVKLSNREIPQYRRTIGIVFQDNKLLPNKTVYENIAFAMEVVHKPRRTIERHVSAILDVVGIGEQRDKFPDTLSAGEKQRVAIARATINQPKLLIADEPTGNLDPATAVEIMKLLYQINKHGTTVVMVTHAKDIVDRMNQRVISIENGHIVRDSERGVYYNV